MRLPDDLAILHQPVRLGVMAALHRSRRVRLAALREALQLTDGNLATHLRALEDAGYVRREKTWSQAGKQAFVQVTSEGSAAILRYAAAMQAWLAQMDAGTKEQEGEGKGWMGAGREASSSTKYGQEGRGPSARFAP